MSKAIRPRMVDLNHTDTRTVLALGGTHIPVAGESPAERLDNAHRIGVLVAAQAMRAAQVGEAVRAVEHAIAARDEVTS